MCSPLHLTASITARGTFVYILVEFLQCAPYSHYSKSTICPLRLIKRCIAGCFHMAELSGFSGENITFRSKHNPISRTVLESARRPTFSRAPRLFALTDQNVQGVPKCIYSTLRVRICLMRKAIVFGL